MFTNTSTRRVRCWCLFRFFKTSTRREPLLSSHPSFFSRFKKCGRNLSLAFASPKARKKRIWLMDYAMDYDLILSTILKVSMTLCSQRYVTISGVLTPCILTLICVRLIIKFKTYQGLAFIQSRARVFKSFLLDDKSLMLHEGWSNKLIYRKVKLTVANLFEYHENNGGFSCWVDETACVNWKIGFV